jgi:predicted MFS family arabinose efflux permease
MWLAVGLVGLSGGSAGDLISRHGPARTHALALAVMSASLLLLAANPGSPLLAVVSAAVFGTGYMTLTGFYLVRSVEIMVHRPAVGPVPPLIATSCGQVAGSAVAGAAITSYGYVAVFWVFAGVGLATAALSLRLAAAPLTAPVSTRAGR